MTLQNDLYQLIHSLTKGEKKVFSQACKTQAGDKAYGKLYELIRRRQIRCEETGMKMMNMEQHPQRYYNLKSYLMKYILRALEPHFKGPGAELERKINFARILIRKRIYPHARKLLKGAMQQARKEERFLLCLKMADLYGKIVPATRGMQEMKELKGYKAEVFLLLMNLGGYERVFEDFRPLTGQFRTLFSKEDQLKMAWLDKEPLLKEAGLAFSVRASRCYLWMRYWRVLWKGDFEAAGEWGEQLFHLFEAHPFLRTDYPEEWEGAQFQLGRTWLLCGKTGKAEQLLERWREAGSEGQWEQRVFYARLVVSISTQKRQWESGEAAASKLADHLALPDSLPPDQQAAICFDLCRYYMSQQDWERAYSWNRKLDSFSINRLDLESTLRAKRRAGLTPLWVWAPRRARKWLRRKLRH